MRYLCIVYSLLPFPDPFSSANTRYCYPKGSNSTPLSPFSSPNTRYCYPFQPSTSLYLITVSAYPVIAAAYIHALLFMAMIIYALRLLLVTPNPPCFPLFPLYFDVTSPKPRLCKTLDFTAFGIGTGRCNGKIRGKGNKNTPQS